LYYIQHNRPILRDLGSTQGMCFVDTDCWNYGSQLEETSGTRNKVVEGTMEGRQERGFRATSTVKGREGPKTELRSVAPAGMEVDATPEVAAAIAEVRDDVTPTTWVVVGYGDDGNIKKPLSVVAKGTGDIDALKQYFDDSQAMYALYRTSDTYDDIRTVKFVYMYWWVASLRCHCLLTRLSLQSLTVFISIVWLANDGHC